MKGWISLLKKGALGELKQAHAIEVIARSVNAQNALIEDILDVSRIISGKLTLETERVSLMSIVANAVEDARPAAEARGLKLISELSSDADEMDGDALRLHQIVNNLLNNAIKFTPHEGEVKVRLVRKHVPHSTTLPSTSGGVSRILRAIARWDLYDVPVWTRNLLRNILSPRPNFLKKPILYAGCIDAEFRMKKMAIGTVRT